MTRDFIQLNDIITPVHGENSPISAAHIVVFIDATTNRLFAMNLRTKNKPDWFSFSEITEALKDQRIACGELKLPDYMLLSDQYIPENQRIKRDQKLAAIRPIIQQLETFLVSRSYGKRLIQRCFEAAQEAGIKLHRTQLYKWVYTYLSAGSIPNAFLRKPGSGQSQNKVYTKRQDHVETMVQWVECEQNVMKNIFKLLLANTLCVQTQKRTKKHIVNTKTSMQAIRLLTMRLGRLLVISTIPRASTF
ncbi:hypothetical protein QYZ40_24135 [Vibrio parahaemolyticus]|nr:hypothetical protein [Vibrio parahaemolyticus]MDN4727528.1 hypothetical protein [Vibrio parahaemolyticus]